MRIGPHEIDGGSCFIIAEAGTSHLGQIGSALAHVATAHQKGADAVKFQMFVPDEPLFCPLDGDEKRRERWNRSAMKFEEWQEVKRACDGMGIVFLASAFQHTAVEWLKKLNVAAYKVASRAAGTYPYDVVPGPFIVSRWSGSSDGGPDAMASFWHPEKYKILQCGPKYPTPLSGARWVSGDGLSDHSGTIWPGLHAMGQEPCEAAPRCEILEVHFAIDKADAGPDAPVCLTPYELSVLCYARNAFAEMRGAA